MPARALAMTSSAAALLLAGLLGASCRPADDPTPRVRIGEHQWTVELATTEQARARGLSGRHDIPQGTGMLFAFPREDVVNFHMLGCLAPLDVAFISDGLVIVNVRTMPVEDDPANPKMPYPSRYPVRYALEVSAGTLDEVGVKVGDRVVLLGAARDCAKDAR